ncbi:transposase [Rhodococcus jostii RHA1] [Mycolicibacterium parafortuitum]|uniref:Transposase [Rhodococcus jostii RHA1] n=1 Tax=Mycolicibacterium parafortuitum TaxID=39692 RepID=A0A375YHU7_MYCPF|nr:transposase [Rhodococcus jostii RHA1] [Mycolicibacterium parafortuitum]
MPYPTLTRQIRARNLRPACQDCAHAAGSANAVIDHPPRPETQWDWLDLPIPPHPGDGARWRTFSSDRWLIPVGGGPCWPPAMTQPHFVDGLDRISRKLGGLTRTWRFDRTATVCDPGSGRVTASFAGVAQHYGVAVAICPARRGNHKGVVEKANHTAAQRWWRTLPDAITVEQAQDRLDQFCRQRGRRRVAGHCRGEGHGGHPGRGRTLGAASGRPVSAGPTRGPRVVSSGDAVLPPQPLLGASGIGVSGGQRHPRAGF